MDWVWNNKEWVFSGIGVPIVLWFARKIFRICNGNHKEAKTVQKIGSNIKSSGKVKVSRNKNISTNGSVIQHIGTDITGNGEVNIEDNENKS